MWDEFLPRKKQWFIKRLFVHDFPKKHLPCHITSDWNRFTIANRRALDRRLVIKRLWFIKQRAMKLGFWRSTPHFSWVKRVFHGSKESCFWMIPNHDGSSLINGCFAYLQLGGGFNVFVFNLPKMVGKWTSQASPQSKIHKLKMTSQQLGQLHIFWELHSKKFLGNCWTTFWG